MPSAKAQQTIYNSPYVTFAPDGKAWTTNAGDQDVNWYSEGTRVTTGIESSLQSPAEGQHVYDAKRQGAVPVGYWEVEHCPGQCIHNRYPSSADQFHGLPFGKSRCLRKHYSGWKAYCADCGGRLSDIFIYMSREAAESIDYVMVQDNMDYYYLCPFCNNLEQGAVIEHICKRISWNRYEVEYDPNAAPGTYGGYMENSIHMYNNATEYQGQPVTPVTRLSKNTYTRRGYEFAGWNTEPDGTGKCYADGAEIWNLVQEGKIVLYAMWKSSRSTLRIDPNGGSYGGSGAVTQITEDYGSVFSLDSRRIMAPGGYTISFEVNGGVPIPAITGTRHFTEWSRRQPFVGTIKGNDYCFTGPEGSVDVLTAQYEPDPVILPAAVRSGSSFGGWYYDRALTQPAGKGGARIVPGSNMTLYAQWVGLELEARDNYSAYGGSGAVDLTWQQPDGNNKVYTLWQSRNLSQWVKINTAEDIRNENIVDMSGGYTGKTERYIVPGTGIYTLSIQGAQGESFGGYAGGKGGRVSVSIWLSKGEILSYTIGSQNGYNGGGAGSLYGSGGGCTIVSSDRKGVIAVAGGGGGAFPGGQGGAGGSTTALKPSGYAGGNGLAGGGGGYRGGMSGEFQVHEHVEGMCNHIHTGSTQVQGGCYTVPVRCGGEMERRVWYWYACWCDDDSGRCYQCARVMDRNCHANYPNCHAHYVYYCKACGQKGNSGSCARIVSWNPGCGRENEYICGKKQGQIEVSKPAYGGSNYVNTTQVLSYSENIGVRAGDGALALHSTQIGYVENLEMTAVRATDLAAPDAVAVETVKKTPEGSGRVKISWSEPEDQGTAYYHKAHSSILGSTQILSVSNVTVNTLTSGIKGYFYSVDKNGNTQADGNGVFTPRTDVVITLDNRLQYLHLAPVDTAGNIGPTIHVRIDPQDILWDIHTKQLAIGSADHVYPEGAPNTYYVRCDGETPFLLEHEAFMEGAASAGYQINHTIFASWAESRPNEEGKSIIHTVSSVPTVEEKVTKADELVYSTEGSTILKRYPYSMTWRRNQYRTLAAVQMFMLDKSADGKRIRVIPISGADYERNGEKGTIYSERARDLTNGLTLIGDGEGPVIRGLEQLENKELIDRNQGKIILSVTAEDALSGVKDFYLEVINTDNYCSQIFRPQNGVIRVEITEEDPLFSGDFTVTAKASDHVGNVSQISHSVTEFALDAVVERILEPHDPVFKRGESGILTITTWGYAERVEVEFPEALTTLNPELDQTFVYTEEPHYRQESRIQFMIPLNTPENETFTITVRAYKGDKKLEEHPAISVIHIDGTVLDDFRTRLR